jgi:hypothetical protein
MSIQVGNPLVVLLLVTCYLPWSSDDFFSSLGPSLVDLSFWCDCAWQHKPLGWCNCDDFWTPTHQNCCCETSTISYVIHQVMEFFQLGTYICRLILVCDCALVPSASDQWWVIDEFQTSLDQICCVASLITLYGLWSIGFFFHLGTYMCKLIFLSDFA